MKSVCIALMATLWAVGSAQSALALALEMPATARASAEDVEAFGTYSVPVGPYDDGRIRAIRAEGVVSQNAFRIEDSDLTTLQILQPLRQQLVDTGFRILFECETRDCGGFDFRYQLDLLPEPEMHVDLGDYRFLSVVRGSEGEPEYLSLMVSRSQRVGFVQISHVAPRSATSPVSVTSTKAISLEEGAVSGPSPAPVIAELEGAGTAILDDLNFPSGSSELGTGQFGSLSELAAFLNANDTRRVLLVGHTDAVGSLEANIALSERRAQSVARRLVSEYGVRPSQIDARGIGFMAPRASNLTPEGRSQNRRVEVVLTSIE